MNPSAAKRAQAFITAFEGAANPALATPMAAYMKNRFPFYGIKRPERNALQKRILERDGYPPSDQIEEFASILFDAECRECQYLAVDILRHEVKRGPLDRWKFYDQLVTTKSWWDTVDALATNCVGAHLLHYPELRSTVPETLLADENMWRKRVAIIHQLKYGKKTDIEFLLAACVECADSKEFFLQKAIGWALRQLSKTEPEAVVEFIDDNDLAPLSKREGLKWLKSQNSGHAY